MKSNSCIGIVILRWKIVRLTWNFSESGVFLATMAFAHEIIWSYARSFELNVDHTSNWLVQYTAVDVITTLNASL